MMTCILLTPSRIITRVLGPRVSGMPLVTHRGRLSRAQYLKLYVLRVRSEVQYLSTVLPASVCLQPSPSERRLHGTSHMLSIEEAAGCMATFTKIQRK